MTCHRRTMDDPMDKPVARRRSLARYATYVLAGVAIVIVVWQVYGRLAPELDAADVVIATVERGDMRAELAASGRVVPTRTELITSPIASRVLTTLAEPGQAVSAGQELMRLDTQQLDLDLQSLQDRVAIAANDTRSVRLEWQEQAREMDSRIAVAEVDLEAAQMREAKYRQLFATRTVSEMDLKEAEVAVKRARIGLEQLRKNRLQIDETMQGRIAGKELEEKIRRQELAQLERRRDRAAVKAPVDGVVLTIIDEPGLQVAIGEELVRIADLSRYRVEAALSEFFAERVTAGDDATVRIGETTLPGSIARVRPGVDGGNVRLDITLREPAHEALKPNRRADVRILAEGRRDTLFVQQAGFARGGASQPVFVIDDEGVARRRDISVGLSGVERVEIVEGLAAGDRVIVSDMRDYEHLATINIR